MALNCKSVTQPNHCPQSTTAFQNNCKCATEPSCHHLKSHSVRKQKKYLGSLLVSKGKPHRSYGLNIILQRPLIKTPKAENIHQVSSVLCIVFTTPTYLLSFISFLRI